MCILSNTTLFFYSNLRPNKHKVMEKNDCTEIEKIDSNY